MTESQKISFRSLAIRFSIGGFALLVLLVAGFIFLARNGGVDVFIAAAAVIVPLYALVAAIYVGLFMGALANNIGRSAWLWGVVGLLTAIALDFLGLQYFVPLALFSPIVAAVVVGLILSISRGRATQT
jgi:hypothetical protein